MIRPLLVIVGLLFIAAPFASAQTRPGKKITNEVSFENAPERINRKFPLSDQENEGKWKPIRELSDEFGGSKLNTTRWYPNNPKWKGRPPTYFHGSNVSLENGELVLRVNKHGDAELPKGFTHTAGFIKSRDRLTYGYLEAEMKLMDAPWVSGFWVTNVQQDWWTEIDICENCPGSEGREYDLNSNMHVFRAPPDKGNVTEHFDSSKRYRVPFRLQDDYHVWGLEWDPEKIRFYIDGVLFREVENTHWHQPLEININNESNKWFGALPDDNRLNGEFRIKYLRVWQKRGGYENPYDK
ncbi:MAG: family 16 glycosylhydrolase [Planctomycetota bacterium]